MKRGYIVPYIIIGLMLVFVVYAAIVWVKARQESNRLRTGLELAYHLENSDSALQVQLSMSISDVYIDTLNSRIDTLLNDTERFRDHIRSTVYRDLFLSMISDAILDAHQERAGNIEDFKTHRAVINNSFLWLRSQEEKDILTKNEMKLFDRVMDGFYSNNLEYTMPDPPSSANPMVQKHMTVLYNEVINMNHLMMLLAHTRSDGLIQKLNHYLEERLMETEALRTRMMWGFFVGIVFTLALIIFFYIRERMSFRRVQNLANDLSQFVDALNHSDIVSKTDLLGNITYINDAFCAISGYSESELIGKPHSIIRHPDTPSSVFVTLWKTIQEGQIFKTTIKNRRKDGSSYYVNTTIIPMKNAKGDIVEYLAVRHDVTELISARDQAISAERFKDAFLSNMSHELRTPLNGIIGFANLLRGRLEGKTELKYINTILESSDHLLAIINDILDLSKIKSEKFSLDLQPVELYSAFHALVERFKVIADGKKITFTYENAIEPGTSVKSDWLRISQIITNLLSNAFKFTDAGGRVNIRTVYSNGMLECRISDTGIGMDEATISRIFHAFEQADLSITRKYGGTGLGLSITKALIDKMGGRIDVHSRVGEGSVFTVSLQLIPTETISAETAKPLSDNVPHRFSGNVLVAEDNEVNRMLISLLLDELGVSHTEVKDGSEAVEAMYGSEKFDLILMDENMPHLSGTEAMQKIRRLPGGDLPIVALTANVMVGDREQFLESGMNDFIPKPIDMNKLKTVLARFLSPHPSSD